MSIWFKDDLQVTDLMGLEKGTLNEYIGIQWTEVGPDYIKARMPVDHRTKQPYGLLHGGASVALAESLGSVAAAMVIDHSLYYCVGIEINANHVRGVRDGFVTGITTAIHLGSTTHVWDIKIYDQREKLVCVSRLTVAILKRS